MLGMGEEDREGVAFRRRAEGARWRAAAAAAAAGLRKVVVVRLVRVNVRMRFGRVGKRMCWVCFYREGLERRLWGKSNGDVDGS